MVELFNPTRQFLDTSKARLNTPHAHNTESCWRSGTPNEHIRGKNHSGAAKPREITIVNKEAWLSKEVKECKLIQISSVELAAKPSTK
jgi:hypothetical protein